MFAKVSLFEPLKKNQLKILAKVPAAGEPAIKRPSPLNVLKDTYDHSFY